MMSVFLDSLTMIHSDLERVWPDGRETSCCTSDGQHYAMKGFPRPVSIGQVEAYLLYNLVVSSHATRAFEIGTGFGYSSFWLGAAIMHNSPCDGWLGSLDNYSEGDVGEAGRNFAISGAKRLGLHRTIDYIVGSSPVDVGSHIPGPIDLAFIDGAHHGVQPRTDFMALQEHLSDAALLVWHDVQPQYGVGDGLAAAIGQGWSPIVFPTSCRLCVCYRRLSEWDTALHAFAQAQALTLL